MNSKYRIGFVSTRLAGTDGVSLETAKWVHILRQQGHQCSFFAGELDWPDDLSYSVPEAHFKHPEILQLNADLFDDNLRAPETSQQIARLQQHLKKHLHRFIKKYDINLLILENALSLPMNVPLGLAITELIAETNLPAIAHHHDFSWERQRYAISAGQDYLRAAFPPTIHNIQHVVINSFAGKQLALRTGVSSFLIPNVMDFDHEASSLPSSGDPYLASLRSDLGLRPDQMVFLQPTRIVPRKRIELAIELTRRMDANSVLVISHTPGDEGLEYETYLKEHARLLGVPVLFAYDRFAPQRSRTADGQKIYSLADAYQAADLVTYPSRVEGFGNAFLEAVYYHKPIMLSVYEIFRTDIQPKGFNVISFNDFITDESLQQARQVLQNESIRQEMVQRNYEVACRHYSFEMLRRRLAMLLDTTMGIG